MGVSWGAKVVEEIFLKILFKERARNKLFFTGLLCSHLFDYHNHIFLSMTPVKFTGDFFPTTCPYKA